MLPVTIQYLKFLFNLPFSLLVIPPAWLPLSSLHLLTCSSYLFAQCNPFQALHCFHGDPSQHHPCTAQPLDTEVSERGKEGRESLKAV